MAMKMFTLEEGIVNSYKDKLLFVYAFFNTKSLNKPECSVINMDYKGPPKNSDLVFGSDLYSKSFGGLNNKIPSWEEFY